LKEPDETTENVDEALFGSLFHHAAEYVYLTMLFQQNGQATTPARLEAGRKDNQFNRLLESGEFTGTITNQLLQPWIRDTQLIEKAIDHVFRVDFFLLSPDDPSPLPYTGVQLIQRSLLNRYLHRLLTMDAENAPFTLIGLEKT
jgi:hypothetical protein